MTYRKYLLLLQQSISWDKNTHHFHNNLSLEEFNVFGKIERVFAAVADHVRIEYIVGLFEHFG